MIQTEQLLSELRLQGELLAHAAGHAELQAAIPSCPGWTVASTMVHTNRVHRWATWILSGADSADFSYEQPELALVESEYRAGLLRLLAALQDAPATLDVQTLWPATSARLFWARRQAHETAIHRVDVELAAGYGVTDFEPDFAADGVDELLMEMSPNAFSTADLDESFTVALTPIDANLSWTLQVSSAAVTARRGADDQADLSVFGLASDMYRWVWNRAGDHEVSLRGNLTLADLWHSNFHVRSRRRE